MKKGDFISIVCGFVVLCSIWPYRLMVRTRPSQGWNRGSTPRRVTTGLFCVYFYLNNRSTEPLFGGSISEVNSEGYGDRKIM